MSETSGTTTRKAASFRAILTAGGMAALFCAAGAVADIAIGSITGADLTEIPHTAAEKLAELAATPFLGLYRLDLLNLATGLAILPAMYACRLALRKAAPSSGLAFAFAVLGAAVFAADNAAFPMLGLSLEYAGADEPRRAVLAAAGEALLAKGAHGSPGALPGFFLTTVANLLLSGAMLGSRVFSRLTALLGLGANILLGIYLLAVTFAPGIRGVAMAAAAPGGLMAVAWMILTGLRLFRLARRSA